MTTSNMIAIYTLTALLAAFDMPNFWFWGVGLLWVAAIIDALRELK